MKKMIAVLLSVMLLLIAATGCSATTTTETTAAATDAPEATAEPAATAAESAAGDENAYDLTGCEPLTVVIATAGGAQNIETLYTEQWMEMVTERTDGLVTFDYTNGGAMGSYAELLDGVNAGAYDMTVTDLSYLNPYIPETTIPCMPFVMSSYDQLKQVYSSDVFSWLQECTESESNMVLLNTYFCGFREILSKDQLSGLADFDGYLIRSPQSEIYTNMFDTLGFSYVTLSWSDTYTGMQTGIVNSVETALMSLYNTGFYELGKYVLMTNHMQAINNTVANKDFWNGLPLAYQDIMSDAFNEIQQAEWEKCIENEEYYKQQLEAEGVTITEMNAADRTAINEAFMSYWQEEANSVGGQSADMLNEILAMAN